MYSFVKICRMHLIPRKILGITIRRRIFVNVYQILNNINRAIHAKGNIIKIYKDKGEIIEHFSSWLWALGYFYSLVC